jgi:hypothetical protein
MPTLDSTENRPRIVIEHGEPVAGRQAPRRVAGGIGRLGQHHDVAGGVSVKTFGGERIEGGDELYHGFGRAAGLGHHQEARRPEIEIAQRLGERGGIEIVEEVQGRALVQPQRQARAGHPVAGKLGQRLGAERGSAGAEVDDVAGPAGEHFGGGPAGRKVVAASGQTQQRQAFVVMPAPHRGHGHRGPLQGGLPGGRRKAAIADGGGKTALEALAVRHRVSGDCKGDTATPASLADSRRLRGRLQPGLPTGLRSLGLPTMVTTSASLSMMRLAMRLTSSRLTAWMRLLRLVM